MFEFFIGLFVMNQCIHFVVIVSFVHDNSTHPLWAGRITMYSCETQIGRMQTSWLF